MGMDHANRAEQHAVLALDRSGLPARAALVTVLGFALCACGGTEQAAGPEIDSWYRGFDGFDPKAVTLPDYTLYRVLPEYMALAERLLEDSPIVRVSWNEAYSMVGRRIQLPAQLEPFLLRAVARGEGSFFVKQSPHALWVGHTGDADPSVPMERRALVVMLESWTFDVYVTTGVPDP